MNNRIVGATNAFLPYGCDRQVKKIGKISKSVDFNVKLAYNQI